MVDFELHVSYFKLKTIPPFHRGDIFNRNDLPKEIFFYFFFNELFQIK